MKRALTRLFRWTAGIIGGLLIVLAVVAVGLYFWLRTSLPALDGTFAAAGVSAPVEVMRDRDGVPFIRARSEADAAYALGVVHAQDRLTQMEVMRRVGAGRLAELVGSAGLPIDRLMRTLGIYRLAEADAARLPPDLKTVLDAYVAGVNAAMRQHEGALPWELALLGVRPEPWRPADTLVWGRLMALQLGGLGGRDLERAELLKALPPERVKQLYPEPPPGAPVTLAAASDRVLAGARRLLTGVLPAHGGSNTWVVDGARTPTGKPILANDPHLGLSLPNLWYLVRVDLPDHTLAGATAPGVPLVVLGRNERIAWGMTTTGGDTADLFLERVDPSDPNRYLAPDGPRPFARHEETIQVRFGEPVRLVVRSTRHGPIVSDVTPQARAAAGAGEVLTLATPALAAENGAATALWRLNHARDMDGFVAALADFHVPLQNVSYADVDGHIGLAVAGRVPVRKAGDGSVPVPGWTGAYDWTGWIPYKEMPRRFDPVSGRLINANNRVLPPGDPRHIGHVDEAPWRAERIRAVLDSGRAHGLEDARALQLDVVSSAEVEPLLAGIAAESLPERSARAVAMLQAWNRRMDRDRPEPLIVVAWLKEALAAIFADELDGLYPLGRELDPGLVAMALEHPAWCDDVHTPRVEGCGEVLAAALQRALSGLADRYGQDMTRWRWGTAHRARFAHVLFGRVPLLRDMVDLRIEDPGGDYTVNRAGMRAGAADDPFAAVHGPGYRAVYDLADLDRSIFSLAVGQSGNPFSPNYDDQLEAWRDGRYRTLVPPDAPAHRLILLPTR